jgi:hypothetical protein
MSEKTDSVPFVNGRASHWIRGGIAAGLLLFPPAGARAESDASPRGLEELRGDVAELRTLVQELRTRVHELETEAGRAKVTPPAERPAEAAPSAAAPRPEAASGAPSPPAPEAQAEAPPSRSVNFLLDAYYGYNFNQPIGRANALRAYDVTSNSFSLNQTVALFESAPDPARGKRFGVRLDLQFGQATQTLQGNFVNETRPEIYRAIFQAYGTYVVPLGKGLTVDFGKWASSLGPEGNYTKDQMNYSRSYWFNFLPFYHSGLRLNYKVSDRFAVNYWLTNGTQVTEANNNYKDQLLGVNVQPTPKINWTVNYYRGQEHPDVVFYPYGNAPQNLPTLQGDAFSPIRPAPDGLLHIVDTYANWQASPRLTLGLEGDYVQQRLFSYSRASRTWGGAAYAQYQVTPKVALAGRFEYISDEGLFSGKIQSLKDTTLTADYKLGNELLLRGELRRDFSNQPFAYTDALGVLKKEQTTLTLGLVFWAGPKTGSW